MRVQRGFSGRGHPGPQWRVEVSVPIRPDLTLDIVAGGHRGWKVGSVSGRSSVLLVALDDAAGQTCAGVRFFLGVGAWLFVDDYGGTVGVEN